MKKQKKSGKINKSLVMGAVVLVLLIACGVVEVVLMVKNYDSLHQQASEIRQKTLDEQLTLQEFDDFQQNWLKLREMSELFLPHVETAELNMRIVETRAWIEKEDFTSAYAQMSIVEELLNYIPIRMIPSLQHII